MLLYIFERQAVSQFIGKTGKSSFCSSSHLNVVFGPLLVNKVSCLLALDIGTCITYHTAEVALTKKSLQFGVFCPKHKIFFDDCPLLEHVFSQVYSVRCQDTLS